MQQRLLLLMGAALSILAMGCGGGDNTPLDNGVVDSSVGLDGAVEDQGADAGDDAGSDADVLVDAAAPVDADVVEDMGADPEPDAGLCSGPDTDGDGIPNACDICALGADQLDADLDTVPNACDQCVGFSDLVDTDMDGVADGCDICPGGDDDADADDDGLPDTCDICDLGPNGNDADGDGTPNACDACAGHPDSADTDSDGVPNGCDICAGHNDSADTDMDGVPNGCDVCAGHDDGVDTDTDSAPDGCDCEPTLPDVAPGVPEVCDTLDNDCSGEVNDGLVGCAVVCAPGTLDWDRDGVTCEAVGRVIYVDETATGAADGTRWEDAYPSIEDAILDAEAMPLGRKQIWIAAGDYQPTRVLVPGTNPTLGFLVPASTGLLGGFTGSEFSASQADPAANPTTVLGMNLAFPRLLDVRQSDVVLDGLNVVPNLGEGLLVTGGAVQASRLVFAGTVTSGGGAPIGGSLLKVISGSVTLEDVSAVQGLLGLEALGGTVRCSRCRFSGNGYSTSLAFGRIGGVVIGNASVTLRNSAVVQNTGVSGSFGLSGNGGGVTITSSDGRLHAEGSTIAGNSGGRFLPGFTYANAGLDVIAGAATLVNSIVQNNLGADSVVATVVSSSVEGDAMACAPLFTSTFRLGVGSLCIDAGDSAMTMGALDLAGAPRIQGAAVDLGAYETQP